MPRLLRLTFGILLAPLLAGCAEQPKVIYSAAELRDELQRRLGAEKGRSIVVPFEVDRALAERAQRFAFKGIPTTGPPTSMPMDRPRPRRPPPPRNPRPPRRRRGSAGRSRR